MKKGFYIGLSLLVGFGVGWYFNSTIGYDRFINRIEEQIMEHPHHTQWGYVCYSCSTLRESDDE